MGVAAAMWELELGVGGADSMGRVRLTVEKMCTLRMLERYGSRCSQLRRRGERNSQSMKPELEGDTTEASEHSRHHIPNGCASCVV